MYKSERLVGYVKDLIGRGPVYARITEGFASHKVVVVHGIGGVGKTQVLLGYVRHTELFAPDCRFALSVPMVGDIDNELAALARSREWVSEAVTEQAVVVAAAWRELGAQGRVLVALDNVEDPEVVVTFQQKLPDACLLVTQREPGAYPNAIEVELAVLRSDEGARFLLKRANLPLEGGEHWEDAVALSVAMEGLTLALNLAGAYVKERRVSVKRYREEFDKQAHDLLAFESRYDKSYPRSVAAAVLLSLSQTRAVSEAAAQLVQTVAFFADAPVPLFLWEAGKELLPAPLKESVDGGMAWDIVVAEAARFGLVQVDASDGALTMHRLTRRVLQTWEQVGVLWNKKTQIEQKLIGIALINAAFEIIEKYDQVKFTALFFQADAAQEWAKMKHQETEEIAILANSIAYHLYDQAKYSSAISRYKHALSIREKILGSEHYLTAISMSNLAENYRVLGDYISSLSLYERCLSINENSSGGIDIVNVYVLDNMAVLYINQGKYTSAFSLIERAIAIKEMTLGIDHPDTAKSLNVLALIYKMSGDYASALPLYQRVTAINEKALGLEHPVTATTINNLASLYNNKGDYITALPLYQRSLTIREKILGSQHPDVAQSLNNLALLYKDNHDYDSALPLLKRALEIRKKVFGLEHPDVAQSFHNLSSLYYGLRQFVAAETNMRRAVIIYENILGLTHADTIKSCQRMALVLRQQGKIIEARKWETKAAAGEKRRAKQG